MPGNSPTFKTSGTGKDTNLAAYTQQMEDPNPHFALSIRAGSGNASAFQIGRGMATEPFLANDSRTYYSCRLQELIINDQGTSGLVIYIDMSGPMDPLAHYATVVGAQQVNPNDKAPNDPTP